MFRYDSGIMTFLGKVADFFILNLLTLVCCIPIITIGASLTAAHYTVIKMHRDSENYVVRNFFRSFKQNFLQSTGIWLLWILVVGLSAFAYLYYPSSGIGYIFKLVMASALIVILMTTMWIFPVQARFQNSIGRNIWNSFYLTCKYLIRTLGMVAVTGITAAVWILIPAQWYWIPILFGISVPVYVCMLIYDKVFEGLEEQIQNEQTQEEQIQEEPTQEEQKVQALEEHEEEN